MKIEYLTTAQLANRWNISEKTLEHWRQINTGCKYITNSGIVLYSILDIENYENMHWYIKASKE